MAKTQNLVVGVKKMSKKKLEEFKQTRPFQLGLFSHHGPDHKNYSSSIDLYDAMPKYFWGNKNRQNGKFLDILTREFKFRGEQFTLKIAPARIENFACKKKILKDESKPDLDFYPGVREELVEDVLRKLACDQRGLFLDGEAGVVFTLFDIHKQLKSLGHTFSINEIKEALYVCASTTLTLKRVKKGRSSESVEMVSPIFQTLGITTQGDWASHGKNAKAYVIFNKLVTESIKSLTFRQINYSKCMAYKKVLSRWLHKRISHFFVQAGETEEYSILLSTIIRDSGMDTTNMIYARKKVEESIREMLEARTIEKYEVQRVYGTRKNKMIDAKFIIFPHLNFINEIITANKLQKDMREQLKIRTSQQKLLESVPR